MHFIYHQLGGIIFLMAQNRLATIRKERIQKANQLRELGIDPYPHSYPKNHTCDQARARMGKSAQTAGRIKSIRKHGRIAFVDLMDSTGQIQLWFQEKALGKKEYKLLNYLDVGDFLGAKGKIIKTKAGEVTLEVESFKILVKSLLPLPDKWHGLKDVEDRYRKRYLDLLLNPEVRKRFDLRSKLVRSIQEYLDGLGYIEVETPTLQTLYGGTNAKPFRTYLNALSMDVYLRIADELYLKRLAVGGYDKVYEICKDFRNEGMDLSHNPEFTMIEFYEAYADYHKIMEVTEGLLKFCAKKLLGKQELAVKGKKISLAGKWPVITMTEVVKRELGLDVEKVTQKELVAFAKKNKVEVVGKESKGELIYKIFDRLVPPKLIKPIWVIDYPVEVCPLQKKHRSKEGWAERFEGYIGGEEICDGWSEINDPIDQRERFEADQKRNLGEEAHPIDEDFIEALEYGMPTLGGIGIGIDRLAMFFTDTWSIKELILFPLMRSVKKVKRKE